MAKIKHDIQKSINSRIQENEITDKNSAIAFISTKLQESGIRDSWTLASSMCRNREFKSQADCMIVVNKYIKVK